MSVRKFGFVLLASVPIGVFSLVYSVTVSKIIHFCLSKAVGEKTANNVFSNGVVYGLIVVGMYLVVLKDYLKWHKENYG